MATFSEWLHERYEGTVHMWTPQSIGEVEKVAEAWAAKEIRECRGEGAAVDPPSTELLLSQATLDAMGALNARMDRIDIMAIEDRQRVNAITGEVRTNRGEALGRLAKLEERFDTKVTWEVDTKVTWEGLEEIYTRITKLEDASSPSNAMSPDNRVDVLIQRIAKLEERPTGVSEVFLRSITDAIEDRLDKLQSDFYEFYNRVRGLTKPSDSSSDDRGQPALGTIYGPSGTDRPGRSR